MPRPRRITRSNAVRPGSRRAAGRRSGQTLLETTLALLLICLIFAGLLQVSQIFAAHEVLNYAAACGARAKTVGFNRWMVEKVVRTAAIPNAGRLREPAFENVNPALRAQVAGLRPGVLWSRLLAVTPVSAQHDLERARIPEYLDSENSGRARYVLDYADWDSIRQSVTWGQGVEVDVRLRQEYPLRFPGHRAFFAADGMNLQGEARLANHYPLYLEDQYQ